MKKYLLWFAFFFPITTWAQSTTKMPWLEQGQTQVGLGLGASLGDTLGGSLRVLPYAQYFLKNKWAIRLEGRYNYNGPDGSPYLGAGLLTQYHFLQANRLSVYGQAGYFYGQAYYKSYRLVQEAPNHMRYERYRSTFNYRTFNLGLGAHYQLGKRWSVHVIAEKYINESVNLFRKSTDRHSITAGFGFRIK